MTVNVIGIDIGGTAIKLGVFAPDGSCDRTVTVTTPQPATPKAVLDVMVEAIANLQLSQPSPNALLTSDPPKQNIKAIGVGLPGPTDAAGRVSKVAINLSDWHDVPLADWLEQTTGLPVILANDANCAGLGEAWQGAGCGVKNVIMLTLGTGVGGAIILDGKLFVGPHGAGGELGLITLNPDGPECKSGNQGSFEQYVSIRGIRRATGKEPRELIDLAKIGDKSALEFWQNYGRLLAAGLASSIYILTPEVIIIGGGVSAAADFFMPSLEAEIDARVLPSSRINLRILPAMLGNQAGIVGAAKLAFMNTESHGDFRQQI